MSKPKANKTKTAAPSKAKAPPKKAKPVVNDKQPEDQSASMKAGLAAVAAMKPGTKTPEPEGRLTKLVRISEFLKRPEGATLDEIIGITAWQKHTVRAFISHTLAKKHGYQIVSEKPVGGQRSYKITGIARGDQPPSKDDH